MFDDGDFDRFERNFWRFAGGIVLLWALFWGTVIGVGIFLLVHFL